MQLNNEMTRIYKLAQRIFGFAREPVGTGSKSVDF